MTFRIDDPVSIGNLTVEVICEVFCGGSHSWGGSRFYGTKRPVGLIIDDGIRKTVWRLPGLLTSDLLLVRLKADLSERK